MVTSTVGKIRSIICLGELRELLSRGALQFSSIHNSLEQELKEVREFAI